ncbi:MAG: protein-glutamate O-methyltransferase CheR [Polyangiaceae bacterium]
MSEPWSEPEFVAIAEQVARRTGLVFAPNRCETLEQAVRVVMRDQSLEDLSEFERRLAAGRVPWEPLIAQMTVGETYFFRDNEHFEFLSQRVLPDLAERRGEQYCPRVWSAGCASGEEAYSLAMALDEQNKLAGAFVLGTDLNRAALTRARVGRYKKWSLRGLDPRRLDRYFVWDQGEVLLSAKVRDQVTLQELNLSGASYPSAVTCTFAMDFVLCRNVLIYLSAEAILDVARRMFDCLSPGGYLIAGPSDPMLADPRFEVVNVKAGIAYRRPLANLVPIRPSPLPPFPGLRQASRIPSVPPPSVVTLSSPAQGLSVRERAQLAERQADHQELARLALEHPDSAWLAVLAVQAISNAAPIAVAEGECRAALARHPMNPDLHYLHALMLLDLGQAANAANALRRAIYLDSSLAIAHFTLGSVLVGLRDKPGAERAFRNAEQCARARPADEAVPLAPEISAQGLATAAARELGLLRKRGMAR